MSRVRGPEWAPERGASPSPRGRTPPEHRRPRSQPPKRATPLPQLGLPLRQDPFPSSRTRPTGSSMAPSLSSRCKDPAPTRARTPFPVRGLCVLVLGVWSPPRPSPLPQPGAPPPALQGTFRSSRAGAPFLRSRVSSPSRPLVELRPHPSWNRGEGSVSGTRPDPVLLRAGAGPQPFPRDQVLPSHPTPSHLHRTAGTGAAEPGSSCLLFRVGWQSPLPARLIGWGNGCVGPCSPRRSVWKEALPLSPRWAAPREPSALERLVLPGGVLAQRFVFASRSWPSGVVERAICSPPNPSIPPPRGSVWGPFTVLQSVFEEKMGLSHIWGSDGEN